MPAQGHDTTRGLFLAGHLLSKRTRPSADADDGCLDSKGRWGTRAGSRDLPLCVRSSRESGRRGDLVRARTCTQRETRSVVRPLEGGDEHTRGLGRWRLGRRSQRGCRHPERRPTPCAAMATECVRAIERGHRHRDRGNREHYERHRAKLRECSQQRRVNRLRCTVEQDRRQSVQRRARRILWGISHVPPSRVVLEACVRDDIYVSS